MRFIIVLLFIILCSTLAFTQDPPPRIVEAKQYPTHYYFKILLNPNAQDGSIEGEEDERRYREFKWGLDQRELGPNPFKKIKNEMRAIVNLEENKRKNSVSVIFLTSEIGNL